MNKEVKLYVPVRSADTFHPFYLRRHTRLYARTSAHDGQTEDEVLLRKSVPRGMASRQMRLSRLCTRNSLSLLIYIDDIFPPKKSPVFPDKRTIATVAVFSDKRRNEWGCAKESIWLSTLHRRIATKFAPSTEAVTPLPDVIKWRHACRLEVQRGM